MTQGELGLPAGCILAHCSHDGEDIIPTANTRIEEHMRITALISPTSADALGILRRGCEAAD